MLRNHKSFQHPQFDNYFQQQRQLERLRQTAPSQVSEARRFVETFHGTKQNGPCQLLSDDTVMRQCRQGFTPLQDTNMQR